jgi:hypothetical protein
MTGLSNLGNGESKLPVHVPLGGLAVKQPGAATGLQQPAETL